jgi:hypothetical protein
VRWGSLLGATIRAIEQIPATLIPRRSGSTPHMAVESMLLLNMTRKRTGEAMEKYPRVEIDTDRPSRTTAARIAQIIAGPQETLGKAKTDAPAVRSTAMNAKVPDTALLLPSFCLDTKRFLFGSYCSILPNM